MLLCSTTPFRILVLTVAIEMLIYMMPNIAWAQSSQSQNLSPRYSQLAFTQNLNIYDWLYTLNFQKSFANGLDFNIKEEFRSTLQSISSEDLWKDNQTLQMNLGYPLTQSLKLSTGFYTHLLSDPLARFDNDVTFHAGNAGINYQPRPNVSVSSTFSTKWQSQLDRADHGFGYDLEAQVLDANWDGYRNDLSFSGRQDFFPMRRNEDLKLRYRIKRQFYKSTADTLTIFFERLRRDNFDVVSADSSQPQFYFVRKLTQSARGAENLLSYRISNDVTFYLTNYIASNTFKVDNLRDGDSTDVRKDDAGFESKHSFTFKLARSKWFGSVGWSFSQRSRDDRRIGTATDDPFGERHPPRGFDTDERFVRWDWLTGITISGADSLGWFASASKFKYDTSDTTAPNNHDLIRWQMTLSHRHQFHPNLKLLWRASVFLNHLVYISGQFSSGNNWERVVQLSPSIFYQPSHKFRMQQTFTVRAKYQTYDFDDPQTSTRNLANRQFILSNITGLALSEKTVLELAGSLELSEQGKLFYADWRQQLALSWRSQELQVLLRRTLGRNLTLSSGANLFHQIRWSHRLNSDARLEKTLRDKHTNLGPIVELFYRPSRSIELTFFGNMQVVYSSQREPEHINRFDLNLNWFF